MKSKLAQSYKELIDLLVEKHGDVVSALRDINGGVQMLNAVEVNAILEEVNSGKPRTALTKGLLYIGLYGDVYLMVDNAAGKFYGYKGRLPTRGKHMLEIEWCRIREWFKTKLKLLTRGQDD